MSVQRGYKGKWKAGCNGVGKRRWFVCKDSENGWGGIVLTDSAGRYRRFASSTSAKRVADTANTEEEIK